MKCNTSLPLRALLGGNEIPLLRAPNYRSEGRAALVLELEGSVFKSVALSAPAHPGGEQQLTPRTDEGLDQFTRSKSVYENPCDCSQGRRGRFRRSYGSSLWTESEWRRSATPISISQEARFSETSAPPHRA
jgi:hypothetical protein